MPNFGRLIVLTSLFIANTAGAVDINEQTRRCNHEKDSITNPWHKEGAECMKLRSMLNMPEPVVIKKQVTPKEVFNSKTGRWCTIYPGNTMQCD
jgi:hypothetical protein